MLSVISSVMYTMLSMIAAGYQSDFILPFMVYMISFAVVAYGALFVLKSIAICKMAKRRRIKWWWVGMLPYANYILLGKLAGPVRIFGMTIQNIGIVTTIVTALLDATNVVSALIPYLLTFGQIANSSVAVDIAVILATFTNGAWYNIVVILSYIMDIAFILLYFSLALAIFGKYAPQKRLVFTILSLIQPLFSIFLFIIRNNRAYSSADEYYREKMANRFGQTYNPYQNPYQTKENPFEDYNTNNNNNNNDNPFDEY